VFFAAIIGFSYSHVFVLSQALAFCEGFTGILMISCFNVSIQHLSSDAMRGRMMSIYATSFLGLPPIGALLAGELSRHIASAWLCCRLLHSLRYRSRCGSWTRLHLRNESGHQLGAVRAALRRQRNIAEAFRACFCRRRDIGDGLLEASHQRVGRCHDKKVNSGCNQQKCDDGIEEVAKHHMVVLNGTEVRFTHQVADERGEDILNERGYNRSESAADDDANRHIKDVAAQNEITKSLQHVYLLKVIVHMLLDGPSGLESKNW
jgi:hypothetical protein